MRSLLKMLPVFMALATAILMASAGISGIEARAGTDSAIPYMAGKRNEEDGLYKRDDDDGLYRKGEEDGLYRKG
ncbi:hypothetical protein MMC10_008055 [Thelotrema lepadinum]|nr:hypothetical protein [Thelotrema lepadinum]